MIPMKQLKEVLLNKCKVYEIKKTQSMFSKLLRNICACMNQEVNNGLVKQENSNILKKVIKNRVMLSQLNRPHLIFFLLKKIMMIYMQIQSITTRISHGTETRMNISWIKPLWIIEEIKKTSKILHKLWFRWKEKISFIIVGGFYPP